jgi:hypothetical protein
MSFGRLWKKPRDKQAGGGGMSEQVCRGDHSGHICVLASCGNFDKIKELTKEPNYICFNCGRVAISEDYLCNPMKNE